MGLLELERAAKGDSHATEIAVSVEAVSKTYGKMVALNNVSVAIPKGALCTLLGPNGAGKTTLVEIIEGLRTADKGTVRIHGLDPWKDAREIKERVGVQLQATSLHPQLTVLETLKLFASFYRNPSSVDELLDFFGLRDYANRHLITLSGGQQQRVGLALALVGTPDLVILDEPTAGLDPSVRSEMHRLLLGLRDRGKTIILTTHYIEEAQKLSDLVAFIKAGEIVGFGPPADLVKHYAGDQLLVVSFDGETSADRLKTVLGVRDVRALPDGRYALSIDDPAAVITMISCDTAFPKIARTSIVEAGLEDVYFQLNGGNR